MRWVAASLAVLALLAGCFAPKAGSMEGPLARHDTIGHVFVIVLENEDYARTFGKPPPSPYLAENLTRMGRLLSDYYGIGHASLGNYVAMVSGQAPNVATQADCPYFTEFAGQVAPDGQAVGQGCVYPAGVKTIADQLEAAGRSWRLYAEDMANGTGQPTACRHPAIGAQDTSQGSGGERDQYATRHVPFVYFHSVIDDQKRCDSHLVDLNHLPADLAAAATTPEFAFIVPDVCSDGHDARCANPRQRGEYDGIDDFLRAWVPRILASPAYQKDGLLVVTFDEAEQGSPDACCDEPTGHNTARPGITGPGGGRTGTVLLAPCLDAGTVDATPYNHYSLLRTLEDLWGLPHLGYAGQAGLAPINLAPCRAA
ncbi:MAG: hypothetical protein QOG31_1190 [Thermoplasmata archaeon]|nr:hypothetical protein [Thermoplasmata archaeon]